MLKEALQYLVGLGEPINFKSDGLDYTSKPVHLLAPPCQSGLTVTTLTGFIDAIKAEVDGFTGAASGVVIHVVNHTQVELIDRASDQWERWPTHLVAKLSAVKGFSFGEFLDHEAFVIGLLTHFVPGEQLDYLIRIASNLTDEKLVNSHDDGISQQVALKQGVSLKSSEKLNPRVVLAPYRTFFEAVQPESAFIFRVRQAREGAIPQCALFEADGGRWQSAAMLNIATYLRGRADLVIPILA